jgi:protein-S-isoprenylcysteine O-methyltransferase Ste14
LVGVLAPSSQVPAAGVAPGGNPHRWLLLVLWGAIHPGERFLHERFGAPYDDYWRRVRRWL